MIFRPALACLAVIWLAGCQLLPERTSQSAAPSVASITGCGKEIPDFADEACLLSDWTAFGLASQRGDRAWRDDVLERLEGEDVERRLARAVAMSWGSERQWDRAAEIYQAELHAAPAKLQPLLRYWLNELEGRRAMATRLERTRSAQSSLERDRRRLEAEKAELVEKLEALTAIEQSINLRQQTD